MNEPAYPHFGKKTVAEHLKEARKRGFLATRETHGTELSGFASSFGDTIKETVIVVSLFTLLTPLSLKTLICFLLAYSLWKAGRSAFLGWARIERLHRLIEEERWEIEHHRLQEKEELKAMYEAKGFQGKFLDEIVDTLMADDNRLLQIMLEEELGLTLEVYEHPLRQALGAFLGVVMVGVSFILCYHFYSKSLALFISSLLFGLASIFLAKKEQNNVLPALIWSLALGGMVGLGGYFLLEVIRG